MIPAVAIEGAVKRFGALRALDGIGFTIEGGEFFGLLGPNGAGKSTLIGAMAGLVRLDAGRIAIAGHDTVRRFRQARASLGVVPQELAYDAFFSVREVLRIQSGYFGLGRENAPWIDELLESLALADKADANMRALSGGMKRRVLIAQALVHRPPVVVLDEPTAGVDVELRRGLWELARTLHRQGHTIVLTTHYLEEAEALCERIAIVHRGRLRALDTKQSLLARYPYRLLSVTLASADPTLPPMLEDLVRERQGERLVFRLHRKRDSVGAVLEAIRGAGLEIVDLHTEETGLETVFLELTAGDEAA